MEGRLAETAREQAEEVASKENRKGGVQVEPRATVVAVRPTLLRPVLEDRSRPPFAATVLIASG